MLLSLLHRPDCKRCKSPAFVCAGSLFAITFEDPPRQIGNAGQIEDKHIKEIVHWIQYNMAELMDVWEGRVNEKHAKFTEYGDIKVIANLLRHDMIA